MNWALLQERIKGLPFLDDAADVQTLASLTAGMRWARDGRRRPVGEYLQPRVAIDLYETHANRALPLASSPLTVDHERRLQAAADAVVAAKPQWAQLFTLPVEYLWTPEDMVSSSNPAYPQQALFGHKAFASHEILCEAIVHELSHVWFAMIVEILPFHRPGEGPLYVLPSGLADRDTGRVVFAATFAAAALSFYRTMPAEHPHLVVRQPYLRRYFRGTCEILDAAPNLTECGAAIAARLRAFEREESALAHAAVAPLAT